MKFMLMIKADQAYEAGHPPNPALMAAMGPYVEKMARSGTLLESGGLFPSSHGARLSVADGRFTLTDGPFAETKELLGGYAIVEVASKAEAIALSREFLQLHVDALGPGYTGVSEIREMSALNSFAPVQA